MVLSLAGQGRSAIVIVALWAGLSVAVAQDTPPAPPAEQQGSTSEAPPAQEDVKQVKLTDEQVVHFIAAQTDLAAISSKIQNAGDTPDPALQAELDGIAKKHGFANFAELDDISANISIVMAGLDTASGTFVDPVDALRKEREDVQKDASIPETEKKQRLDELTDAINTTPQLQFKENIDIVKAHRAEIEKALQ